MAVATMRVPTVFTAVDKFSDVVTKMSSNVNRFSKNTHSAVSRVDNRLNRMWGSMNNISQLAIGGGVGGLFYYAGKDIKDYEVKIASLAAVTGTKIGAMNSQIESLGKKTKISVIDITGAFEIVGSKMSQYLDNPDALKSITDASITLSRAARMELEPAIGSLTTMMNVYQLSAKDAANAVNKLSAGETVGSKSIAETASIIPQFGAQAVRANVSLAESIALVQTLAQSLPTEGIGRGLRNILFDISSTETWDKNRWRAIKMAGVDFEFVTNNANKLTDRLKELRKLELVKGGTELFFKRVNSIAANTLFQNLDKGETSFVNFLDNIIKLDDAEAKAAKNMSTLSSLIDQMKASFTNYVVTGNEANGALGMTKSLIGWLTDNMGTLISLVEKVVFAFLGWKIIVGIVFIYSKVMMGLNAIMRAYTFINTLAALSNVSFGKALSSATSILLKHTGQLILARLASLAYFGAILGGVAVIGFGLYKVIEGFQNMQFKSDYALRKVSVSWINTTDVISEEIQKQKNLIASLTNPISEGKYDASRLYDLTPNVTAAQEKISYLSKYENSSWMEKQRALNNWNVNHTTKGTKFRLPGKNEQPDNLAGSFNTNLANDLKSFMSSKSGKLDLNITAPSGYDVDVNGTPPQGINVITKPNQGQR